MLKHTLWCFLALVAEEGLEDGGQAGEAVGGVDVVLDDVEGEVVGAAEAPDGQGEEGEVLEGEDFEEEGGGGEEAGDQEEDGLEVEEFGVGEVGHGGGRHNPEVRSQKSEVEVR